MEKFQILDELELLNKLPELKGWKISNKSLHMALIFKNFAEAIGFINKVAKIASELDHHPQITNIYSKVELLVNTHEAGDRITTLDIAFARKVSDLL